MKKIVSALTVTALINLILGGCSKVVNLTLDEVAVDTPKLITGVVSRTGDKVIFDQEGGKYNKNDRTIIGTARYGESIFKRLNTLDSVLLGNGPDDGQPMISIAGSRFDQYCKRPGTDKIVALLTNGSQLYKFAERCRMDTIGRAFLGPFEASRAANVPFDSVAFVRAKVPDRTATTIVAITGGLAFGAIVCAAVFGYRNTMKDFRIGF